MDLGYTTTCVGPHLVSQRLVKGFLFCQTKAHSGNVQLLYVLGHELNSFEFYQYKRR